MGASQPSSKAVGVARKAEQYKQVGKQQERGWAAGAGRGSEERRETDGKTEERMPRKETVASRGWVNAAMPHPMGLLPTPAPDFHLWKGGSRKKDLESMVVGKKKKGEGWGTFLPLDLWERKRKKKATWVIWFCSKNP